MIHDHIWLNWTTNIPDSHPIQRYLQREGCEGPIFPKAPTGSKILSLSPNGPKHFECPKVSFGLEGPGSLKGQKVPESPRGQRCFQAEGKKGPECPEGPTAQEVQT